MKLAWLVWRYNKSNLPEIHFSEPYEHYHFKIVPIVYSEIVE